MILAQKLLPAMIAKGEGAVINIGSVSGIDRRSQRRSLLRVKVRPDRFHAVLYDEVREHGIIVSVILPGFVDTTVDSAKPAVRPEQNDSSDDVAQAVHYVLSSPSTSCPVEITVRPATIAVSVS